MQGLLESAILEQSSQVVTDSQRRNEKYFDAESDKLDQWADDLKDNLERELKTVEIEIREAKKANNTSKLGFHWKVRFRG